MCCPLFVGVVAALVAIAGFVLAVGVLLLLLLVVIVVVVVLVVVLL